jgi:hypothetical protein
VFSAPDARETEIASRVREWESYQDSHNGDWGPAAMALALKAYGATATGLCVRRPTGAAGAAKAIAQTNPAPCSPGGAHLQMTVRRRGPARLRRREDPRPSMTCGAADLVDLGA